MRHAEPLHHSDPTIAVDRPIPDSPVITVSGALDITTAPALRARLGEALATGPDTITVDLTEVTFIDSTGLAAIVHASRRLTAPEKLVLVLAPDSYAHVVLDATGLRRRLNVVTAGS